jgi:hypothetical protein
MAWVLGVPFSKVTMDLLHNIRNPFTEDMVDYRDFYVTGTLFGINGCVLTLGYFDDEGHLIGFVYGFLDPIYRDYHVKMITMSAHIRGSLKFKMFRELRAAFNFIVKNMGISRVWALTDRSHAFRRLFDAGEHRDASILIYGGE